MTFGEYLLVFSSESFVFQHLCQYPKTKIYVVVFYMCTKLGGSPQGQRNVGHKLFENSAARNIFRPGRDYEIVELSPSV
jgi:hypothetical protein